MQASVHVIRPGLLTTVQDLGRWGWQASGVSVSGAMDPRAHRLANGMVGNPPEAATLEITFVGPELEFGDDRLVALSGAEFAVMVGEREVNVRRAFEVPSGARLRFGERVRGARAYLAIGGGVAVDPVLGSRATHVASRLGGYLGRPLLAGDRLPLGAPYGPPLRMPDPPVVPAGRARVRVLPSPHVTRFRPEALDQLQSGPYRVSPESDRMGFRLDGPAVGTVSRGDELSEPSQRGAIQVPPSGHPILLMADCQTTGGYPILATVISADVGVAGQLGPGDTLSFTVCTRQDAIAALIAQERSLMAIE